MAQRHRKRYDDGFGSDDRFRKPREGSRGRGGPFKNKDRSRGGRYNPSNRAFDHALNDIRRGRYGDRYDIDEFVDQDPQKWVKLSVIFGAQLSKGWIADKLREIANEQVPLVNYHIEGRNVAAFIRTRESVVKSIRRQSQNFVDPSGKRLTINITSVMEPSIARLTDWMEDAIKECLKPRLVHDTMTLNLNDFNKDPHLTNIGLYLSLSRQNISQFVIGLLVEHLNDLNALNLSNNMLETLVNFKPLVEKFKNLKHLNLSHNRLRNEGLLDVFKPLESLESLELQGNPFVRTQNMESFGK